jgi:hypothetical protein
MEKRKEVIRKMERGIEVKEKRGGKREIRIEKKREKK